jgi:hypothetical protein
MLVLTNLKKHHIKPFTPFIIHLKAKTPISFFRKWGYAELPYGPAFLVRSCQHQESQKRMDNINHTNQLKSILTIVFPYQSTGN